MAAAFVLGAEGVQMGLVDELNHVLGSRHDPDEAWCLLEEAALTLCFGRLMALGKHCGRRFGADDKHAANRVRDGLVVERAVAIGPLNVFQSAVAGDRHELVLVPGCSLTGHHLVDLGPDYRPDFGPNVARRLTK